MTLSNFIMGLAGNFIVAGVVAYLTNSTSAAAISFGIGLVLMVVGYYFGKKKKPESATAPPTPTPFHQENKQEFKPEVNPQVNISVGNSAATAAAPAPTREKKPEPRCNIKFIDVAYGQNEQTHIFSKFVGQSLSFATAKFENEAIKGQELLTPTLKARAIYRRADGSPFLDISNLPWVPSAGDVAYTTFEEHPEVPAIFFPRKQQAIVPLRGIGCHSNRG